jgi:5-hydroxyisourate hydrolase-like protein (transthyretin family)
MRQFGRIGGLVVAVLFTLGGCGDGPPPASSSTEQAKVKGTVSHKGKPVADVEVRFNAANVNRKSAPTATATTKDDGSYEVTTLVGENTVSLGGAGLAKLKDAKAAYFSKPIDVKAGENPPFDIDAP